MRKKLVMLVLLALAAISAGSAGSAGAYSVMDHCQFPFTSAVSLSRTNASPDRWNLTYDYACNWGDGPRVGLQVRDCGDCNINTAYFETHTNGEGYNALRRGTDTTTVSCIRNFQYRMFVQSYDNGAYHIDTTPWRWGSEFIACPVR